MDATTLTAALLHDAIEDTEYPVARIEERFGPDVARLVEGVTKISRINMTAPETRQAENVRKMLLAMVNDVRVVLVKLADRLHNMRTLEYLSHEKQQRISRETLDIYAPIAHRLGMGRDSRRARGSGLPFSRAGSLPRTSERSHGQEPRVPEVFGGSPGHDSHEARRERDTCGVGSPCQRPLFAARQNPTSAEQPRAGV